MNALRCSAAPSLDNRMSATIKQASINHQSQRHVMPFVFSLATKPYPSVAPGSRTRLAALSGFPRVKEGEALRFTLLSRAVGNGLIGRLMLSDENSRRRRAACRVILLI